MQVRIVPPTTRLPGSYPTSKAVPQGIAELAPTPSALIPLICHDLRQPLAVMRGQAQLLARSLVNGRPEHELRSVQEILRSADQMGVMIQDLLDADRLEAGGLRLQFVRTDLNAFLRDVCELLSLDEGVAVARLQLDLPERLPEVTADPERLERVVVNLVGNARKHTGPCSTVVVRARESGAQVVVSVLDQGVGIAAHDLSRVFDKYFCAGGGETGHGLGLYIAKLIVEGHGGRIWAESELGKGSAFHLMLPSV